MAKGIYSPAHDAHEWEEAYITWAYGCEKNLRCTERDTGIPYRTLSYHKAKSDWDERYATESDHIAGFAFSGGLNDLRLGVSTAVRQLIKDACDEQASRIDRLASQKLFFSLIIPRSLTSDGEGPKHLSLIDARSISVLPQDVSNKVSATQAIEANLSAALTEQSYSKRGKTRN